MATSGRPLPLRDQTVAGLAVLDMAGTTVAVADGVPAALHDAFERVGFDLPAAAVPAIRGRSKDQAIRQLVERLAPPGVDVAAISRTIFELFRETLLERVTAGVEPVPGASVVIDWLRANGAAVYLTTGFDRVLAGRIIDQLGWTTDRINGVITADDVPRGRPYPDLVLSAMAAAGVTDPASVVVVGDTAADLEAASSAGILRAVGVLTGAHTRQQLTGQPHAAILDSIADLPAWLMAATSAQADVGKTSARPRQ